MAPAEPNVDYYAVLEISNIATTDVVIKNYRRLAKIRHPDRNPNLDSTAVFQLLQNAYDTINDPAKRRAYDLRWPSIRDSVRAKQESDKRQAEAAQTEEKKVAEARARKQKEDTARQERLRDLELVKSRYDSDIFELSRVTRKLAAELKRLQDQDDEELREERERNGWWAYLASPIYGKASETDEQKQARETKRLDRVASKSIKGSQLDEKKARLQRLHDALQDVSGKIAAEKKKADDEMKRAQYEARARKLGVDRDARDRAMREMRERMARAQKESAERAAREAREAQAAQEAEERAAAARRRRDAEERARTMRAAEEKAAAAAAARRAKPAARSTCRHGRFWPKIEGAQLCSNCCAMQRRFAFECPGCGIVACASCRGILRGERAKKSGGGVSGRRYKAAAGSDGYGHEFHDLDWD